MALSDGLVQSMGMGRVFKVCSCWLSSHTAMALPPAAGSSALPCLSSRHLSLRATVSEHHTASLPPVWAITRFGSARCYLACSMRPL